MTSPVADDGSGVKRMTSPEPERGANVVTVNSAAEASEARASKHVATPRFLIFPPALKSRKDNASKTMR